MRFCGRRVLLVGFYFCAAGTDNIEAAGIPVFVDYLIGEFDEFIFKQSGRSAQKAEQSGIGVAFFIASYKPQITLCPPGACPPERMTPAFIFFNAFAFFLLYLGERFAVSVRKKFF